MEQVNEFVRLVGEKLAGVAKSDTVVGTPIEMGEVTIVPISRVSVGLGGGGGSGEGDIPGEDGKKSKGSRGKGTGGGSGGGVKIRPSAVAVFSADGVEILPVQDKPSKFERLFDKIPELADRFKKDSDDE